VLASALFAGCGDDGPVEIGGARPAASGDTVASSKAADRMALDAPLPVPVPGDAPAAAMHLAKAQRAMALGLPEETLHELKAALAADPAHLDSLLFRGFVGMQKTFAYEPLQALAAYRTARLVEPRSVTARVGEATARIALEDDARAAPLLEELLSDDESGRFALSDEQRAIVWRSRAELRLRAGRFDDALLDAERALKLRETDRASLALRAEVLERLERGEDALSDVRIALSIRGDDATLHFVAARLLRKLGRGEEAARHQRAYESLRRFEEDASKSFREDWPLRIRLRREFVAAWPEWTRGRHQLVRELLGGLDLASAQDELSALIGLDPADAEAWYLQARVRIAAKDFAGAVEAIDRMMATGKVKPPVRDELLRELAQAKGDGSR
jgi:tetratricopeptide (TPR) repeat protein